MDNFDKQKLWAIDTMAQAAKCGPTTLYKKGVEKGFTEEEGWVQGRAWALYYNHNPKRPKYPIYIEANQIKVVDDLTEEQTQALVKTKLKNRAQARSVGKRGRPSGLTEEQRAVVIHLAKGSNTRAKFLELVKNVGFPITTCMAHYYWDKANR
jgi:hypothetical protein